MKYLCLLLALCAPPAQATSLYEAEEFVAPNYLTPLRHGSDAGALLLVTEGELAQFLILSSFEPDRAIAVDEIIPKTVRKKYPHWQLVPLHERQYIITATEAKGPLKEGVELSRIERQIGHELAVAIQRTWARMLLLTRYPTGSWRGLDGATYRFSTFVRGMGRLEGEIWSPDTGLPAEMVALGEALMEFTVHGVGTEEALVARLQAFEAQLPKPQP